MTLFADALSSFFDAYFVIYGVPYDRSASFRVGQRYAPEEIRRASYNYESIFFKSKLDLRNIPIHDMGDLGEFGDAASMIDTVEFTVSKIVSEGKFPIGLGGEHTITLGAIKGLIKEGIKPFVISIDAHSDFRDEYLGDHYSHACVMKRVSELIGVENIAIIGVRSISPEEILFFDKLSSQGTHILMYSPFDIRTVGLFKVLEDIEASSRNMPIYITLDMDGLDPAYAPGVGTPEPFGLDPYVVSLVIEHFSSRLVGFDVVEITPPYDNGITSILAAYYVRQVISDVWRAKNGLKNK
ncbi:MAG: agmatinase [Thermoplasmata archaeon]|nr:agmatinase [Euryarchaeota archaeon]RLF64586.1 MAG: agmatinase [Thermoplasmata archaeon]